MLVVSNKCPEEPRISAARTAGTRSKAGLMGESESYTAVGMEKTDAIGEAVWSEVAKDGLTAGLNN